ncbi:MAG: exo-alpha-sialidase [Bacteroidetes bacterium]|nr:exo-alpha-sialidase [Bacteroidota bacterium]
MMKIIKFLMSFCLLNFVSYAQYNTTDIEPYPIFSNDDMLSESSVFIDRTNPNRIIIANNLRSFNISPNYGLNVCISQNKGATWAGNFFFQIDAYGDPSCTINLDGRIFVSYLKTLTPNGIHFRYSDDNGVTWSNPILIQSTLGIDKPFLMCDTRRKNNSNLMFCAYRNQADFHIKIKRSTTSGQTWDPEIDLCPANIGGVVHQSPNIAFGPDGSIYVCWAIYDIYNQSYQDESGIGFAKSVDGGQTWNTFRVDFDMNTNIIGPPNYVPLIIRGINNADLAFDIKAGTKHPSFPTMAINQQNGNIYIAWANRGLAPNQIDPLSKDICFIKSIDNGNHWSSPKLIFEDASMAPLDQWQPYMACDPYNGVISVVYYNSTDFMNNNGFNAYNSLSNDNGASWVHTKISDFSTTGLKDANYVAHDFNGNDLCNSLGVPVWCDRRNGLQTVYAQPYEIPCVTDLSLCNPVTPFYKIEKAQNNIVVSDNCNYEIVDGSDIRMFAGNSILMKTGFHAAYGSTLHTKINSNCVPENVQKTNNYFITETKFVKLNRSTTMSVNPNPVADEINITLTNACAEKVTLVIYDNNGNQVKICCKIFQSKTFLQRISIFLIVT